MKVAMVGMMVVMAAAAAAVVAAVSSPESEWSHPERKPGREVYSFLDESTASYANLMFRSFDHNHDKKLDERDIVDSGFVMKQHVPGISKDDFASFIKLGDSNGDGKLDQNEFFHALNQGLKEAAREKSDGDDDVPTALVEEANTKPAPSKVWKKAMALGKGLAKKLKKRVMFQSKSREVNGKIDVKDDGCVMCQYMVERMEINVNQAGIFPGASLTAGSSPASHVWLEESATLKFPTMYDHAVSSSIEGTRDTTRLQRQAERQKYNEIWRVTDLSLDDSCEESMPNMYYQYCKQLYQQQSQVVDGLRMQFRASDICYRIGMCSTKSYLTMGVHSRYPQGKVIDK